MNSFAIVYAETWLPVFVLFDLTKPGKPQFDDAANFLEAAVTKIS